jgi:serine phosphatase RsbU (regulator of sigma subunit)
LLLLFWNGDAESGLRDGLHYSGTPHRQRSADEILEAILSQVQEFSQGEQADDMTLIVARGR